MTTSFLALSVVLLAAVGLSAVSTRAVELLRPRRAVPILAIGALVAATATGLILSTLALATVAAWQPIAAKGQWSPAALQVLAPVPPSVGIPAGLLAAALALHAVWAAGRTGVSLLRAERLGRSLRGGGGPVVIVDDESADAFTLAGLRGCVVISRRLLDGLPDADRRMLTAHEMSHLRHRHHWYLHAVDLAAAANPLLRPVSAAMRLGVERWADEDAATVVGDRTTAARALARTALVRSAMARAAGQPRQHAVAKLGAVTSHLSCRAEALLSPAPSAPARRSVVAALLVGLVLAVGVAPVVQVRADIEQAEMALPGAHVGHGHPRPSARDGR